MDLIFPFIIIIASIYIIRKSSSVFDVASNFLTRNLGEGIKGPTINAVASSLPELLISSMFLFYFKDIEGFSAGFATIIGSSAFNIAVIPVVSFFYVYSFDKGKFFEINRFVIKQDVIFLLLSIIILLSGFFIGINEYFATLLILFYFLYIYFVIKKRSRIKNKKPVNDSVFHNIKDTFISSFLDLNFFSLFFRGKITAFSSVVVGFLSVIIIGFSCYCLVFATDKISDILNVNIFFTAFIIAAIASSIPDTILSIQDAKNEKFSDSFSNAFGSNIFDICIGIGLPVFIYSLIHGPIPTDLPIDRMGFIGDYILSGDLFLWSLLVLFVFTALVSFIYYKYSLKLSTSIHILFLYLFFILALILY